MDPCLRKYATLPAFCAVALAAPAAFAKRAAPADVPPVVSGNVRYEAPHFSNPCNQNGGCVVAYDNMSNALLWSVEVYCTHYDPSLEQDVQDVFITSVAVENGQVLVTDEKGRHFTIDSATRQVTGDARGCEQAAGGGCSYAPAGNLSTASGFLAVLGAGGLATAFLRRKRTRR